MNLRAAWLIGALLFCGCAPIQAGSQAAEIPAPGDDSSLTGLPPQSSAAPRKTPPRATLVALPPRKPPAPSAAAKLPPAPPPAPHVAAKPRPAPHPSPATVVVKTPAPTPATDAADSAPVPSAPPAESAEPATPPATEPTPATPLAEANVSPGTETSPSGQDSKVAVLETSFGRIVIELDDFAAPKTCKNFRQLVQDGFYNHTVFHRVIPNFIIQGGDPMSKSSATDRDTYGQSGPGYTIPPEIALKHDRGAVAMARLPDSVNPTRDSNGSQFYICLAACPTLDDQYTVFGHVIQGMDVADKIAAAPRDKRDNPVARIEVTIALESRDPIPTTPTAGANP